MCDFRPAAQCIDSDVVCALRILNRCTKLFTFFSRKQPDYFSARLNELSQSLILEKSQLSSMQNHKGKRTPERCQL